ncbi:MAG: (2Fe-2S)-binding protein [Myxococcales bacterium]|nr:(2Fe-2S)-binding protein [Myxococcales bacterium]
MAQELVKIKIDGKEVEVPQGTLVIQAAEQAGVEIPHYCYHPHLSRPAVCRMCLVDIEGQRKLQPSCSTTVQQGQVIHTKSSKVREAVREVLEFTLINHPLDCPVCDQAGECGLQNYYQDYGLYNTKFTLPKVHKPKVQKIGPTLTLDAERCILCSRCVRFTDEVTGTHEMGIMQRGDHAEIQAVKEVNNPYSTNLADICPVGALTQNDFRFKVRVWYLKHEDSVCPGCARGCNTVMDYYRGEAQRMRPRNNDDVNKSWMCDDGRLLYKAIRSPKRLTQPMLRKEGALAEVKPSQAFSEALKLLNQHAKHTATQGSAHLSNEDAAALGMLLKMMQAPDAAALCASPTGWEDDQLLRRADQTPNRTGVAAFCGEKTFSDTLSGAKLALVIQEDALPDRSAYKDLETVIFVGTHANATSEAADIVLPIAMWAEYDGSFTNFQGRVQRFRKVVSAPEEVEPFWRLASRWSQAFGGKPYATVADAFRAFADASPRFAGMTFESLGALGVLSKDAEKSEETDA